MQIVGLWQETGVSREKSTPACEENTIPASKDHKLPLMLSALFHASDSLAWPLSLKHLIYFIFFHQKDPNETLLNGASCCLSVSADEAGVASLGGHKHHVAPIFSVIALWEDWRRSFQVTAAKSKTG